MVVVLPEWKLFRGTELNNFEKATIVGSSTHQSGMIEKKIFFKTMLDIPAEAETHDNFRDPH